MAHKPVERHTGLPDLTRPEGLCPRCRKQSSFEYTDFIGVTFDKAMLLERDGSRTPIPTDRVAVLYCRNCRQGIVVVEHQEYGEQAPGRAGIPIQWRGVHWWPNGSAAPHAAIPSEVASALQEAEATLSANCYRAATIMARHALEAVVEQQGAPKGNLASRVKALADSHKLQKNLADWATEVRLIGNASAHDPLSVIAEKDARDLLAFMRELVSYLYVLPFELQERRAERNS